MTALGGYWKWTGADDPCGACARILAAQDVFGPHGTAVDSAGPLALGRSLYRLLPEDAYDKQPVWSADGGRALVADIRLDNRGDLLSELGLDGLQADRVSDSAVLMAALERWGETALERIVGAFAFALWDQREERLLLARDPMGQRPLHFHRGNKGFAFASMPRGLHALSGVRRIPDQESATRLLALHGEEDTSSFFAGIGRVVPGECTVVTAEGETRRRFWHPPRPTSGAASSKAATRLEQVLDVAIAAALRGTDGRVGAQLSAGLDSSAVVVGAARQLSRQGGRVTAFTAAPRTDEGARVFPDRLVDEAPIAAATAAMYSAVEHVIVPNDERLPTDLLDDDLAFLDRPALNPFNMVWVQSINAAAQERGLTVVLTGQMGNLTISYAGRERLAELFDNGNWWRLLREAASYFAAGGITVRALLGEILGRTRERWRSERERRRRRMAHLSPMTAVRGEFLERVLEAQSTAPASDPVAVRFETLMAVDPGNFNKAALASHGIDMRDPTADLRVVEFCFALPLEAYFAGGVPRRMARELLAGKVPQELLAERRKGVQASDWHRSLEAARPEVEREVAAMRQCPVAMRVIDVERLERLLAHWPQDWGDPALVQDYHLALVRAVAVGHFLRGASTAKFAVHPGVSA